MDASRARSDHREEGGLRALGGCSFGPRTPLASIHGDGRQRTNWGEAVGVAKETSGVCAATEQKTQALNDAFAGPFAGASLEGALEAASIPAMPIGHSDEAGEAAATDCMTIDLIEASENRATARNTAVIAAADERP